MIEVVLLTLICLQLKHWYIDFVNQTEEEIKAKVVYGKSINHSAKHAIGTMIAIIIATGIDYISFAVILGFLDLMAHYHIDWVKARWGHTKFWPVVGLDQMAHQLTYIGIVYLMI